MNKFLLDLALASTVSAAWIPIGHGPTESSKDAVVSAAIPTIADADLDPEFGQPMRTTQTYQSAVIPTIADPDLDPDFGQPMRSTQSAVVPTINVPDLDPEFSQPMRTTRTSPVLPTDIVSDFDPEFGQPMRTTRTVVHTSLASDFDPEFGQPMRTTKTYESAVVPTIHVPEDTVILRPIQSTKTFEIPVETLTSIIYVPGPCNTGSCHPSFTTKTVLVSTGAPAPTSSSGCSPACPSLCPPAHLPRPIPSHPHRPVPVPTGNNHPEYHNTTYPEPRPIEGKFWTIKDLTRHCAKDGKSCDYKFAIEADGKTEHCNINRKPGSDAALESWTNVPCNKKSHKTVSWGYVTEPAPAFAVVTVVEGKVLAWFGVADINGQKVTSSKPFGSGHYGNLGPDQVYTY
ncbi:unnamed protein product [Fusarium graminearum]|nr:unnamed protein product [Fusarium graminearum]VTO85328.1 unnamed protein product [Fusarium graminearum]